MGSTNPPLVAPGADGDTTADPANWRGLERVLLAGDTHGDTAWVLRLIELAIELTAPAILQTGDFGACWPGNSPAFEHDVTEALAAANRSLVFVDGNHEGWDGLAEADTHPLPSGFVAMTPRIFHAPRALRWEWTGRRFGALGGAYTTDRLNRREGEDLWAELELPTEADLDRLGPAALDVLVTHDAPVESPLGSRSGTPYDDQRARIIQRLVSEAMWRTEPALVAHGHWHRRYRFCVPAPSDNHEIRIEGLAANVGPRAGAFGLLELGDLTFRDGATLGIEG